LLLFVDFNKARQCTCTAASRQYLIGESRHIAKIYRRSCACGVNSAQKIALFAIPLFARAVDKYNIVRYTVALRELPISGIAAENSDK